MRKGEDRSFRDTLRTFFDLSLAGMEAAKARLLSDLAAASRLSSAGKSASPQSAPESLPSCVAEPLIGPSPDERSMQPKKVNALNCSRNTKAVVFGSHNPAKSQIARYSRAALGIPTKKMSPPDDVRRLASAASTHHSNLSNNAEAQLLGNPATREIPLLKNHNY